MFVSWRQRPVKGKAGGPFLKWSDDWLGRVVCWMPLECKHRGEGRIAWTPYVIHAERIDGKPRQRIISRLPTIRTCCIADPFNRAAWWHHVNTIIRVWREREDGPEVDHFARDKSAIFAKLREVVPRPTPQAQAEFDAFCLEKEREYQVREAADREWWWAEGPGKQQREARQRAEANGWQSQGPFDFSYEAFNQASGTRPPTGDPIEDSLQAALDALRRGSKPACFAVLGIEPAATADQVKAAYRELAKFHHPDVGGKAEDFKRIRAAYEQAMTIAGKASA